MSSYQKTTIIGNLGNDPETRHFDGGSQMTTMSIATTEHWNDKQSGERKEMTEWHRIILNGKLSELANKYLKKGAKVLIEGKLRTRKYTATDGVEKYVTEIIGREMKFLSPMSENNESAVDQYQQKQTGHQHEQISDPKEHDDLPF